MSEIKLLQEAFSDEDFRNELQKNRIEIEEELSKFIKAYNDKIRIFENLESRLKSIDSFNEKLRRKDYISLWNIVEGSNQKTIQNVIRKNLPDLIGFRINCFFFKDEKTIYDNLEEAYKNNFFSNNIKFNFNENTIQQNGHAIFKVTGTYNDTSFEVQIKCSIHNIWGEVEHKRVYKNRHYDANKESKIAINEEIFNILQSSDKQLETILSEKLNEKQLIQSMFYFLTHKDISKQNLINILDKHYSNFFKLIVDDQELIFIKEFIAKNFLGEKFELKIPEIQNSSQLKVDDLKHRYINYSIEIMMSISKQLFVIEDLDEFIQYIISKVEKSLLFNEDEILDDEYYDMFNEDDLEDDLEDKKTNAFVYLDEFFDKKREH